MTINKIYNTLLSVAMLICIGLSATSCLDKYPEYAIPEDKAIHAFISLSAEKYELSVVSYECFSRNVV